MNKKSLIIGAIVICLLGGCTYAWAQTKPITITVNGKYIPTDTSPQIVNNRVMVPLRAIATALGAEVKWDAVNNQVSITTEQPKTIKFNGEVTSWPYWYENGILYLEYRNAMELIKEYHNHPSYFCQYFRSTNTLSVGSYTVDVEYIDRGNYRTLSLNDLKKRGVVNYDFDPTTGSLTTKPF